MVRKLIFMQTLEVLQMLLLYLQMMLVESVFSEANFCIWRVQIIRQRKSSLQHTVRLQNLWQERK